MRAAHGHVLPAVAGRAAHDRCRAPVGAVGSGRNAGVRGRRACVRRRRPGRSDRAVRGPSRSCVRARRDRARDAGYAAGRLVDGAQRPADRPWRPHGPRRRRKIPLGLDRRARRSPGALRARARSCRNVEPRGRRFGKPLARGCRDGAPAGCGRLGRRAAAARAASVPGEFATGPRRIPSRSGLCGAFPASRSWLSSFLRAQASRAHGSWSKTSRAFSGRRTAIGFSPSSRFSCRRFYSPRQAARRFPTCRAR